MKTLFKFLIISLFSLPIFAQEVSKVAKETIKQNSFQIIPYIGYDHPVGYEEMQYIGAKGGLDLGLGIRQYWKSFGIAFDFDYIKNHSTVENIPNPFKGFYYLGSFPRLTTFDLTTQTSDINRLFFGIGPSYRFVSPNQKFNFAITALAGYGKVKGGQTMANGISQDSFKNSMLIAYHSGYDAGVLTVKPEISFAYFFTPQIGVNLNLYYMHHFKVAESQNNSMFGSSNPFGTGNYATYYEAYYGDSIFSTNGPTVRGEGLSNTGWKYSDPIKMDYASVGGNIGLVFALGNSTDNNKKGKSKVLSVVAIDKISGKEIPNTNVEVKNNAGVVVASGITDQNGKVVFDNINPDNYSIMGNIADLKLNNESTLSTDWNGSKTVNKKIYLTSKDFVIEGKVYKCNSNIALENVKVVLERSDENLKKNTVTNAEGKFLFHLEGGKVYQLYGTKGGYMSQTEEVNPSNYNREKSLFVKLEICAEEIDCDKIFKLNNIHYDLDKYDIRRDAEPELNKLVSYLQENPTIRVELSSHTDSRADNAYNQTLSQNRANAAKDYLVSNGIAGSRIVPVGYGESRLLNKCADGVQCSEAEHQLNRRTEFKIICEK